MNEHGPPHVADRLNILGEETVDLRNIFFRLNGSDYYVRDHLGLLIRNSVGNARGMVDALSDKALLIIEIIIIKVRKAANGSSATVWVQALKKYGRALR